ncbi:hypothetical protein [Microcoleus sp. herbarium2]|uniref:hypothetical protein n=1 Tax=Microcoleus sp. herbarium2 TaxID=3055433 RepID=UPI002FD6D741
MVQHVVDYPYSHPDYRRRFTAVSTARAMPARVAEGSLPGRKLFGTLVFHLPSFFMTYAETGLMYENTAWSAMGEKTKVMRVPVRPRLYLTKAVGTHLQTPQL